MKTKLFFALIAYLFLTTSCNEDKIKNTNAIVEEETKSEQVKPTREIIDINQAKNEGFQIFDNENFIIKCPSKFKEDVVYYETAKSQGMDVSTIKSYVASENTNSYEEGVIYNIVINDLSSFYDGFSKKEELIFDEKFFDKYITDIKANNFKYKISKSNNKKCIHYNYSQAGLPTKAMLIIDNKKSYMLQVASRKNLDAKFEYLITNFKFIK